MTNLIFLIIGFGAGCYYMWRKFKKSEKDSAAKLEQSFPASPEKENSGIAEINKTRQNAKVEAKNKILKLFSAQGGSASGGDNKTEITNDDVQRTLGVSDATATNYLNELEQEGHITQIGKEGRGVKYTRK